MSNPHADSAPWWGDFEFEPEQALQWRIGPSILTVCRRETEWLVRHGQDPEADEDSPELAVAVPAALEEAAEDLQRFVLRRTAPRLSLAPRLADRPVVVQPRTDFTIPPREQATVFVSTPLWIQLSLEGVTGPVLDAPLWRPSDTWFGASTREGELCYSSRTRARARVEELPMRPHRAVTPVLIHNETAEPLAIERLSLPVPYLALYAGRDGHLWTQAVTLRRRPGEATANLELDPQAPAQAAEPGPVSGPRRSNGQTLVVRAWSSLFKREA